MCAGRAISFLCQHMQRAFLVGVISFNYTINDNLVAINIRKSKEAPVLMRMRSHSPPTLTMKVKEYTRIK